MKRLLLLALAAACATPATAQVSAFAYRAERAPGARHGLALHQVQS